jgi:hypothetical protein
MSGNHGEDKPQGTAGQVELGQTAHSPDSFIAPPEVEPMTLSLMGKLFGVPLLIIGSIVGAAVLVVALFGAPATPERRSIAELLQSLESSSGERSLGVLLPKEKELWQTALELATRLEKKESEVSPEELKTVADRLGALVVSDLAYVDRMVAQGQEREDQQHIRGRRLEFLIHAVGRTGREEAVEPLLQVIRSGHEPFVATAMIQLAELKDLPGAREGIESIMQTASRAAQIETRLVAYTTLSAMAEPGNRSVIEFLTSALHSAEGETNWSAALALARLGSLAGKNTLMDLLDRRFWESQHRYERKDAAGVVHRYPMPAGRVNEILIAAIEATAQLDDPELWTIIEGLQSDSSLTVRAAATNAVTSRRAGVTLPGKRPE